MKPPSVHHSQKEAKSEIRVRPRIAGLAVRDFLPYVVAVALCIAILVPVWHLRHIDLTVPLGTISDHNLVQEVVALAVRDAHFYVNPLLGAPGQQELYDFPVLPWAQFLVLLPIRLLTRNPGLALNLFYFLSYPLITVTALYALRRLGISTILAIAGALLYAFIPFHQLRNEGHLIYSCYYFVPLVALVVIWVSTGHELFRYPAHGVGRWVTWDGLFGVLVCVAIGWDNPYYAFFGAMLLCVSGLLGWLYSGSRLSIPAAVVLLTVLVLSFSASLLPTMAYWQQHGRASTAVRSPAESEIYGLTIVQLLAPVTNHRIPAAAAWKGRFRSSAVLVNENDWASLGVIGSVGFLALLGCLFVKQCPEVFYSISILNLFCVLLGTIGGFGTVFSYLISPQLRGFNRISVYISFFCTSAVLLLLDRVIVARLGASYRRPVTVVAAVSLLLIGIPDQVPRGLTAGRPEMEAHFKQDETFIRQIERVVPPHAMIFQLPYDPFPETPPINKMTDYDEMKGYLHSDSLRWSYGAMKDRADDKWIAAVSREPIDQMLLTLVATGFGGVYIDRNGYQDGAAALESQLRTLLGHQPVVDDSGRLAFFVLDANAVASLNRQIPLERRSELANSLNRIVAEPGQGCWGREGSDSDNWHWCSRRGGIEIMNASGTDRKLLLEMTFATVHPEDSTLIISGVGVEQKLQVNSAGTHWQATLTVPPGEQIIKLASDAVKVVAPSDSREMFFRVNNFKFRELNP